MAHDCPICQECCDCDLEDHYQPPPPDCRHDCDDEWWEDDYDDWQDDLDERERMR